MRKAAPIHIIVYPPVSPDGKNELAQRIADIHAQAVIRRVKELPCPTQQKLALLDSVIETVIEKSRE